METSSSRSPRDIPVTSDRLRCPRLDPIQIRRGFERAASAYNDAAAIEHRIGDALLEHLEAVRLMPRRILDLGTGTGTLLRKLVRRYRHARVIGLDSTLAMLKQVRPAKIRLLRRPAALCATAERVPLMDGSVDMIVSSGLLQWCGRPELLIAECARILRPDGLLALATVGSNTLRELREIYETADSARSHVHRFLDMHDLGDALVRAGFTGVVMDADRLTLTYPDLDGLYRDLRSHGAMNAAMDRPRSLAGRTLQATIRKDYEPLRIAGKLPVTCEAVYAHAWRARTPETRVDFSPKL